MSLPNAYAANYSGRGRHLVATDHFSGERQVGQRAARILVVQQHRLAETRRLGQAHVARDHRAEHLFAEVLDELRRHLVGEVVARVVHGAQQPFDLQLRVQAARTCSIVCTRALKPFERVVLALHRHQHRVGGDQRVHCQHVQRRRAVDQDHVELVADPLQRIAQLEFAPGDHRQQPHFGHRQVLVRRQQLEAAGLDLHQRLRAVHSPSSTSQLVRASVCLVDAAAHGGIALRIEVDQQHTALGRTERCGQVDGRRRLADAAFLVCNGNDPLHGRQSFTTGRSASSPGRRAGRGGMLICTEKQGRPAWQTN